MHLPTAMLPSLIKLNFGIPSAALCTNGFLHRLEPFILETMYMNLKPGTDDVKSTAVAKFKNEHTNHLSVLVETEEVGNSDALVVTIRMQKELIGAIIQLVVEYKTADTKQETTTRETWTAYFKRGAAAAAVNVATLGVQVLVSAITQALFKKNEVDITLRVSNIWLPDSLNVKIQANVAESDKGKPTHWLMIGANFLYKTYHSRGDDTSTSELSWDEINNWFTEKIKTKIHGQSPSL